MLTHHNAEEPGQAAHAAGRRRDAQAGADHREPGSGSVQEKEKALLAEIIEKVNDLFEGDLTDQDKLVYVNNVHQGQAAGVGDAGRSRPRTTPRSSSPTRPT